VQKEKATEDTMVLSLLKCASHFRNSLCSNKVISGDRDSAKINLLILKKFSFLKPTWIWSVWTTRESASKLRYFLEQHYCRTQQKANSARGTKVIYN